MTGNAAHVYWGSEEVRGLRAIFAMYPPEERNGIKLSSVRDEETGKQIKPTWGPWKVSAT